MTNYDPRHDPAFQPGFDPAAPPPPSGPVEAVSLDAPAPVTAAERTPRNPWLAGLVVTGVVFLVLGLVTLVATAVPLGYSWVGDVPPWSVMFVQALWVLPTPLITAGVLAILVRIAWAVVRGPR